MDYKHKALRSENISIGGTKFKIDANGILKDLSPEAEKIVAKMPGFSPIGQPKKAPIEKKQPKVEPEPKEVEKTADKADKPKKKKGKK